MLASGIGGLAAVASLPYVTAAAASAYEPRSHIADDGRIRRLQVFRTKALTYEVPAAINGHSLDMLVDTGANITVLTRSDAAAAGLLDDVAGHRAVIGITREVVQIARAGQHRIDLGPISIEAVPVAIDQSGELNMSILGQDAFCGLRRITIEQGKLELMHDGPTATGCPT
ncbi:hypothetical protein ETR14_27130 (plasmid) [Sphingosinicella sp. BN140058]|nr:hypothetical protein ETR14_27130 [Sphingosinicella sp. BN140058]